MGRRCRHLNPAHAGAGIALDARYLTGYSNGAKVTSWPARPRTSGGYTGASNYPTFSASVAGAGNQPGVTFSSGASQRLIRSGTSVIPDGSTTLTVVDFSTGGTDFIPFAQTSNTTFLASFSNALPVYNVVFLRGYFAIHNGSSFQELVGPSFTNGIVVSGRLNGTTLSTRDGWSAPSTATISGSVGNATGTTPQSFRTGTSHALSVFATALPDPLLRRITDHYGYSFKSAI